MKATFDALLQLRNANVIAKQRGISLKKFITDNDMGKIKVTQTRSYIKRPENQKRTLKALGLKNIGHSVEHDDSALCLE